MTTPAQIRQHYDSLALVYRTFWGEHLHHGYFDNGCQHADEAQVKLLEHCLSMLKVRGGEQVLDVGCGFGATLQYLARNFRMRGLGLTISPKQAQFATQQAAKAGFAGTLQFVVADAECFPLTAEQFDLIWVMESSEHFADKAAFLRNAAAALRRDGQLLLASWNGAMKTPKVQAVAKAFLCPELWSVDQYSSAMASAKLKVKARENLTANVMPTWTICKQRVSAMDGAVKLLPRSVREFLVGIDVIHDAYSSGDLTYNVFAAHKIQ